MKIGPYEVLGEVGRGGSGVVFRARGPDGAEVAVKLLAKIDPDKLARFERERRLLGGFTARDGFVPLIDAGVCEGAPYLVMPLVAGGTLRKRLERGPLGVAETVALAEALADALGRAHERGIVHRDLKPENILFTEDGKPLIADLGLAKHFDRLKAGASQSVSLSARGVLRGTAAYIAPEQIEDASSVGPQADVFALGAILYECLAGRPAFHGETLLDLLSRVSEGRVEPLKTIRPKVPAALATVVETALARDPAKRFADALALRRALRTGVRAQRRVRRSVASAVLILAAAGIVSALARETRAVPPAAAPPRSSSRDEPNATARLLARADDAIHVNDVDRAIDECSSAIRSDPGLARAWGTRGLAKRRKGDLDGATADSSKAIELDPKLASAWTLRGMAKLQRRDLDGAIADFSRALEVDPKCIEAWGYRGIAKINKGDPDGAIADCSRAVELDPKCVTAWGYRGCANAKKGRLDSAIADLSRALELDPMFVAAWVNRGVVKMKRGDVDGEIADCSRALEIDSKFVDAWYNRGLAKVNKGELDGAIADLSRALELDPKMGEAWCNRGVAKGDKGDLEGAIADCSRALELDPRFVEAWGNRGAAKGKNGDSEGAIPDLEHYLELAPDDPLELRATLEELKTARASRRKK